MVMSGPPAYFVVTVRGELGPFDLLALREALGRGDVTNLDQVRSPMGSPLGTVCHVLKRNSDRSAPEHSRSQTAPTGGPPWSVIAVIAGLLLVVLLLFLLGKGSEADPAVTSPAPVPPPASRLPDQTKAVPAPAPPTPQGRPAPSVPPAPPPTSPAVDSTAALNLLSSVKWDKGKTTVIENQMDGTAWTLRFADNTGWAGFNPPTHRRDWRSDLGLLLSVRAIGSPATFQLEIVERSRERHIATFKVQDAQWSEVRIPWSQFKRNTYQGNDPSKAAPADGLQVANITFVAIVNGGGNVASALGLRCLTPYR